MAISVPIAVNLAPHKTGLTLQVQLYDADGTANGSPITGILTERTNGIYVGVVSLADTFDGAVVVEDSSGNEQSIAVIQPADFYYRQEILADAQAVHNKAASLEACEV